MTNTAARRRRRSSSLYRYLSLTASACRLTVSYALLMAGRPWPVTGSVRCAVEGLTAAGVNWANVFWLNAPGSTLPTSTQCAALASAVYTAYQNTLLKHVGTNASMESVVVNWYGAQPSQVVGVHSAHTVGAGAAVTEVDSLSAVISWTFPATWRGGKPRTYLPCIPNNSFTGTNRLSATYIAAVLADAATFITDMNGITVTPFGGVVFALQSFFSGNVPRTPPVMFPITGAQVHPRISTQRKRLGREVP
jgi:hypothetical protein